MKFKHLNNIIDSATEYLKNVATTADEFSQSQINGYLSALLIQRDGLQEQFGNKNKYINNFSQKVKNLVNRYSP